MKIEPELHREYKVTNNKVINKIKQYILNNKEKSFNYLAGIVNGEKEVDCDLYSIFTIDNNFCDWIEFEYPVISIAKEMCFSILINLEEDTIGIHIDEEYYNKFNNDKIAQLLKQNSKSIDLTMMFMLLEKLFKV